MLFSAAQPMYPNMLSNYFFGYLDLKQPMPQSVCAYMCAYVYFGPSATSPARGVIYKTIFDLKSCERPLYIYKLCDKDVELL